MPKIVTWNVNGLRSLINDYPKEVAKLLKHNPDIIGMSETKLNVDIPTLSTVEALFVEYPYKYFNNSKTKKGYSGTAVFAKMKPLNVTYGMNKLNDQLNNEGRMITLEYEKYYVLQVYTPNSGQVLERLTFRTTKWDKYFWKFVKKLQANKPVIVMGDLNVARSELDIHDPTGNLKSAGYTIEERTSFEKQINKRKMIDVFRYLHPSKVEYTYFSYFHNARNKNKGWRLDYFMVSQSLIKSVKEYKRLDLFGSDHLPIMIIFQ
jgi:exodeoxyribonuclease-3